MKIRDLLLTPDEARKAHNNGFIGEEKDKWQNAVNSTANMATIKASRVFKAELEKLLNEYKDCLVDPRLLLGDLVGDLGKIITKLESEAQNG